MEIVEFTMQQYNLRDELEEITKESDLNKQVELVQKLSSRFDHGIKIHKVFLKDESVKKQGGLHMIESTENYNCFEYAFDVYEFEEIAHHSTHDIFFGSDFMKWLLEKQLLLAEEWGDIILYDDGSNFTHAGKIIKDDMILSKWGGGNMWKHKKWETPSSFSNNVATYKAQASNSKIMEEFLLYSQKKRND